MSALSSTAGAYRLIRRCALAGGRFVLGVLILAGWLLWEMWPVVAGTAAAVVVLGRVGEHMRRGARP